MMEVVQTAVVEAPLQAAVVTVALVVVAATQVVVARSQLKLVVLQGVVVIPTRLRRVQVVTLDAGLKELRSSKRERK
jgi:hypothetical protein